MESVYIAGMICGTVWTISLMVLVYFARYHRGAEFTKLEAMQAEINTLKNELTAIDNQIQYRGKRLGDN